MPRGDKTGPNGMGPMTGRRMGYCVGNDNPGFGFDNTRNMGLRRGFNRGGNRGRFRFFSNSKSNFMNQTSNSTSVNKEQIENKIEILKKQLVHLENELKKLD